MVFRWTSPPPQPLQLQVLLPDPPTLPLSTRRLQVLQVHRVSVLRAGAALNFDEGVERNGGERHIWRMDSRLALERGREQVSKGAERASDRGRVGPGSREAASGCLIWWDLPPKEQEGEGGR